MAHYYLNSNTQSNGDHEVHTEDCTYLPSSGNRVFLGSFSNCRGAVAEAKGTYPNAKINGCYYCSKSCHTS